MVTRTAAGSLQPPTGPPAASEQNALTDDACTLASTRVDAVSAPSGPHTCRNMGTGSGPLPTVYTTLVVTSPDCTSRTIGVPAALAGTPVQSVTASAVTTKARAEATSRRK